MPTTSYGKRVEKQQPNGMVCRDCGKPGGTLVRVAKNIYVHQKPSRRAEAVKRAD